MNVPPYRGIFRLEESTLLFLVCFLALLPFHLLSLKIAILHARTGDEVNISAAGVIPLAAWLGGDFLHDWLLFELN